ncbi:MAG: YajQ family cyclic di-GMP-binding protein [Gemmatimonadales bacterium]|nr:YajQ family cyclic di-GMP-binding protein [Gemmatimonadales bacterium]
MPSTNSFDISTGADLQEVDNAVNQALKEIAQRYDFKGTSCTIELDREKATIRMSADDEFRMEQLSEVLRAKFIKRNVPLPNATFGDLEPATGTSVRRTVTLAQGIAADKAKAIQKSIKEGGFRKVTAQIQGEEIRVSSPSRDELQAVIAHLRQQEFGIELKFGNFRG